MTATTVLGRASLEVLGLEVARKAIAAADHEEKGLIPHVPIGWCHVSLAVVFTT